VFLKTHLARITFAGMATINTAATRGAVYLVRNPLDVACSLAPHMNWTLDHTIQVMATRDYALISPHSVVEIIGSWSQNVESWTNGDGLPVVVLRYEDMITSPAAAFASVVAEAGLPASAEQIQRAADFAAFGRLSSQETGSDRDKSEDGSAPDRKFYRQGKAGGWRETLSANQVKRIVAAHQDQMARFGYLRDL
jgi:hypothetical protein